MKHITDILKLSLPLLLLAAVSCRNAEENIFGQSAAERMTDALENYEKLLNDAPNGWVMEYYANTEPDKMGGFLLMAQFNKGVVRMSANLSLSGYGKKEGSSGYSLIDIQGPVLSFNTYNPALHYFSDPSSGNPAGFRGDVDFVIEEGNADRFVLTGLMHRNKIVMRKMKAEDDWSEFQTEANKIDSLLRDQYRFEVFKQGAVANIIGLEITSDYSRKSISFVSPEGEKITQSFVPVPGGIQLYEPVTISGVSVERFDWDEGKEAFLSAAASESLELKPAMLRYEDYPGTYVVYATSLIDPDSVYVTVTPKTEGVSFTVSEELFGYPFTMNFLGNRIEIPCQMLSGSTTSRSVRLVGMQTNLLGGTSVSTTGSMSGYWREGFRSNPGIHIEQNSGGNILLSTVYGFRVREYDSNTAVGYLDNGITQEIRMYKKN